MALKSTTSELKAGDILKLKNSFYPVPSTEMANDTLILRQVQLDAWKIFKERLLLNRGNSLVAGPTGTGKVRY